MPPPSLGLSQVSAVNLPAISRSSNSSTGQGPPREIIELIRNQQAIDMHKISQTNTSATLLNSLLEKWLPKE